MLPELNKSIPKEIKLHFDIQTYFPVSKIRWGIEKLLQEVKYPTDGIILAKENAPYKLGFNENISKWKEQVENTLDFLLKEVKQDSRIFYELHIQYSKGVGLYDYISQEDNANFTFSEISGKIVECYWDNLLSKFNYKSKLSRNGSSFRKRMGDNIYQRRRLESKKS